jgi:hypothetical protein
MDEFSDGKAIFLKPSGVTHIYSTGAQTTKPYGYFRYDIKLDAWVQNRECSQGVAFYTAPPNREWVGLTDKEIQQVVYDLGTIGDLSHDEFDIARAVIAKLKEKNT